MTNGPYVAGEYEKENFLRLTAGEHYDAGQQGPETLTFRFAATAEEGQALYDQKQVDLVWPLTEERLGELVRDESWSPVPTLETFSVVYHCAGDPLEDQAIRQALSLAVDRERPGRAGRRDCPGGGGTDPAGRAGK